MSFQLNNELLRSKRSRGVIDKYFSLFILLVCLGCTACQKSRIETIAGTGKNGTIDGPAKKALVANPFGVVRGPDDALWFCEYDGHAIRRIDKEGNIKTIVGNGMAGYSGDGGAAIEASLNKPHEIRFDAYGDLYIADMSNQVIRKVDMTTGKISTVAGNGIGGFSGDGGRAVEAQLKNPHSLQFGPDGNMYIADVGNNRVRVLNMSTGTINTLAGNGEAGPTPDGISFRNIPLNGPRSLDFDSNGDMWLVLKIANQIFRLDLNSDRIYHVAGTGEKGFDGNGGDARLAKLSGPKGIAIGGDGNVYIADTESHSIRMIDIKSGVIDVVVGTGERFDGSDGDPLKCGLARPHGVFVEEDGSVLIGDSENHKIRVYWP